MHFFPAPSFQSPIPRLDLNIFPVKCIRIYADYEENFTARSLFRVYFYVENLRSSIISQWLFRKKDSYKE